MYPRVTDHIPDIIAMVAKLVATEHAYVLDGNVYYSVGSFPDYGKLSGRSLEAVSYTHLDVYKRQVSLRMHL